MRTSVRVKPLVWERYQSATEYYGAWQGQKLLFTILRQEYEGGEIRWQLHRNVFLCDEGEDAKEYTYHQSLIAAQSAAQAEWNAFILAALEPVVVWPPPLPVIEAPRLGGTYTRERFVAELVELGMDIAWIEERIRYTEADGGRFSFSNYTSEHGLICWCPRCDKIRFNTGPDSHRYLCRTCGTPTGGGNLV